VRALEVCLRSNEKISVLREKLTMPLPYEFIKIGLTRERKELYRLIDNRVDDMVRAGLEKEVEGLLAINPDRTPFQAIGYKEFALFLRREISKEEAVRLIKRNTRRYAKRQFTWFRKEEGIRWIDVTGFYDSATVFAEIMSLLKRSYPGVLN
jgi:tRNA dimethylallyltransferase